MIFVKVLIWMAYVIGLYFLVYWFLFYLDNLGKIRKQPRYRIRKYEDVTVVVPAYNEENTITKTLDSLMSLHYPKQHLEILVMNDGSKDRTRQVVESYIREKDAKHIRLINQRNQGKAAAMNNALKIAKGKYYACLDADSYVDKDALTNMVAYFQANPKVSIITPIMRVATPKSWMQKFQRLEYLAAMLTVKMMSFMDCHYVAPGPFSIYKTSTVLKLGGFDTQSIVEDQEICCRAQQNQYKIAQCTNAYVYTYAPYTLKGLHRQRNRWFKGTLLNVMKFRHLIFNRKYGDFGFFQLPLILLSYFLGFVAVLAFLYYTLKPLVEQIQHLFLIDFDILPYFNNLHIKINFLAVETTSVFIIYLMLSVTVLMLFFASRMTNERVRQYGSLYIVPYFFVYFIMLGFILIKVLFELATGKVQKW